VAAAPSCWASGERWCSIQGVDTPGATPEGCSFAVRVENIGGVAADVLRLSLRARGDVIAHVHPFQLGPGGSTVMGLIVPKDGPVKLLDPVPAPGNTQERARSQLRCVTRTVIASTALF
jgi:hypothetical protein